jgi:protein O-GlcNAc transferase
LRRPTSTPSIARARRCAPRGRRREALEWFDRAIAAQPDYAVAWANRGYTLGDLKQVEPAIASLQRARAAGYADPALLGALFDQQLQACDWTDFEALRDNIARLVEQGRPADLPFSFLSHSTSAQAQLQCAEMRVRTRFPQMPAALWTGDAYGHDKIRVAYVSSDFRDHAVAHLIAGLFERHDRARFEITGYALGPRIDDSMRRRIAAAFDQFHDVADLGDMEVAGMIRAAETDIAVDLNGFTTHCRPGIFAHRCAPVQINYLGYPGAMGSTLADYILDDPEVIPAGAESAYGEQVIRLPHAYQINDARRQIAERTPSRAEVGLPQEAFVFCCFNANYKINPPVFDVWMRLLGRIEGSVLWLFESNPLAARNLRAEAEARGMAGDRIVFAPRAAPADHLARHRLADLFLDTGPYNTHTTASDALWAGLPLVTCRGETFASRVAASLLRATGLPELITDSLEAYEALAHDLATNPARLDELRARLAATRDTAPLFDTDLSRRHIEAAYAMAHERQRAGQPPAGFDVPAA